MAFTRLQQQSNKLDPKLVFGKVTTEWFLAVDLRILNTAFVSPLSAQVVFRGVAKEDVKEEVAKLRDELSVWDRDLEGQDFLAGEGWCCRHVLLLPYLLTHVSQARQFPSRTLLCLL